MMVLQAVLFGVAAGGILHVARMPEWARAAAILAAGEPQPARARRTRA